MQPIERSDYEQLSKALAVVFNDFNTQKKFDVSPGEAADILIEPLEFDVAFKGLDDFLDRVLTRIEFIAQERLGMDYETENMKELYNKVMPILEKSSVFAGWK